MPIAPDGILQVEFDAARNLVMLIVDGGMWASPVERVSITRSPAGAATVPVRGVTRRRAAGGTFYGSDNEAPMDSSVTYQAMGYDADGALVGTSTVTVSTTGAEWGVWLKAPGNAALTVLAAWHQVGDWSAATQGGVYQIPSGGGSIPQWSGVDTESGQITVSTYTAAETARLRALLREARVLLIQTGAPEEIASGYYYVATSSRTNPAQLRSDHQALRRTTLDLTATSAPAGDAVMVTGVTYGTVRGAYATYQALLDANLTYADVQQGV